MKRRWWILGAVVVVGASPLFLDEIPEEELPELQTAIATEESSEAPSEDSSPEPEEVTVEATEGPEPTETAEPEPAPEVDTVPIDVDGVLAADVLETLEVKGRAPKTGYDRSEFGQRWADTDRNGCDTRNDILDRDLTGKTYKPGTRDCVVLTGILISPYTGDLINFQRGESTSSEVQIDHVVALSDAWQKGAQQLSSETRELFANDPLNLLAVDGHSNSQKGAGDAATWLPKNRSYRCDYVARQVGVKAKYDLWVTAAEKDAIKQILSSCADQVIPEFDGLVPVTPSGETQESKPEPTPAPTTPAPSPQPTTTPAPATSVPAPKVDVYYANCTEARAAGAAPLFEGEPGYRLAMDGDKDGIACE